MEKYIHRLLVSEFFYTLTHGYTIDFLAHHRWS